MRLLPFALLVAALSLPALPATAQEMTEIDETLPLPGDIQAVLDASLASDEVLDRVRRWEGDLDGDGAPDQLVQAAIAFEGGGNGFVLGHWLFAAQGNGFAPLQELELPNGVISATVSGNTLQLRLYKALDGDPNCCPSGEETLSIPLP